MPRQQICEQLEHWARIGKLAEENPDLPYAVLRAILVADQQEAAGEYLLG
jgi:hypothetical protein